MTRPLLPALLVLTLSTGCFGPSQPEPEDERSGTASRRTGKVTRITGGGTPTPGPQGTGGGQIGPGGGNGSPDGTGTGTATVDPSQPTPTPFNGATPPAGQPESGLQIAFEELPRRWGIRPYLNRARAGHGAGIVSNRLLVVEGEHRPSLEVLSAGSDRWELDDSHDGELGVKTAEGTTLLQGVTLGSAATAFANTELWLAGGLAGILNSDGSTGSFQLYLYTADGFRTQRGQEGVRTLTKGRYAAAGGIIGGNFIVAGGISKPGEVLSTVELVPLSKQGASTPGAAMPVPVAGAAAAVSADDRLYVLGGYTFAGGKPTPVAHVQVFDTVAKTWKKDGDANALPPLPVAMHGAAAVVLDGNLYVAGGFDAQGKALATAYSFSLVSGDRWVPLPPMPTARGLLTLSAFRGSLWAVGGVGADRKALQTVEAFQP